jgi:hypothetical protein
MTRPAITTGLHLFLAAFLSGCAPERLEAEQPCPEPAASEAPGFEHACEHAELGPFGNLDASRGAVELRNTHMLYTVALGPTARGYGGELRFTPRATGRFGIYLTSDFPLVVRESEGELCLRGAAAQPPCDGLARAQSYDFVEGRSIVFSIAGAATSTIGLVVELL